jgi:hypothetical protein
MNIMTIALMIMIGVIMNMMIYRFKVAYREGGCSGAGAVYVRIQTL